MLRRNVLMATLTVIVAGSSVLFAACAGTRNPAVVPVVPANRADRGTMSARIDGQKWTFTVSNLTYKNGILSIGGADTSNPPHALGFAVRATGPGTYEAGSPTSAVLTNGSESWQASIVGGSGSVKITSLTATGASGTFSFVMIATPNTSASGTRVITEGVFNVKFSTPIDIPAPTATAATNAAIQAQVDGKEWRGVLAAPATYRNQFFSITGFDASGSAISFGIGMVTGPGTYSMAYGNTNGSSAIYSSSSGQGWNTFLTGGTGSITITTLTAARATGTFSFDAVPVIGGATGTVHVTNGNFDVALQAQK